jgi:ABC-type transport system involved in multi-copper enzyme maturation permease subunit
MKRIWTMAGVTFHEAARKKLLLFGLLAGFAFLAFFATGFHVQEAALIDHHAPAFLRKQVMNGTLLMGLYAVNMLVVVMTVLISVDTLSGEIASGAIQAIATKPVRRWELVSGKWLGFVAMLSLYIVLMVAGANGVSHYIAGTGARHLLQGIGLIWIESMLLLSVTLCFGTTFSTLTNGVLVLGLHGLAFLGGWMEQAGAVTNTHKAVLVGIVSSVIMPSEAMWRRAAFEMQSPLMSGPNLSPFSAASVPSPMMIAYAGLYAVVFLTIAAWRFSHRDL